MIPLHINEGSEEGTSSVHRSNSGKKNLDNFNSWWEEAGHLINYFVCLLIVTLLNNLFYDIAEGEGMSCKVEKSGSEGQQAGRNKGLEVHNDHAS